MNTNIIQQYKGYYWVGKNKKRTVAGIITRYSDGRIELELIGSFDSDEKNRLGDFINQNRKIRIVYGLDSDSKDITLFVIRPRAKTNLSCPFSIVTYSVVYFVYGKHVAGLDEPYKIEANVQFPELTKWCPPGLIKHGLKIGKNGVEKVVIETNDILNYTTKFEHKLSDGTKVAFKGDCQTEISECNIYPVLFQWTDFCISHDNGITIRKIIKTISRFEKFLSFAAQRECHQSGIKLLDEGTVQKTEGDKTFYKPIYLYLNRSYDFGYSKANDIQYLFRYSEVEESFASIISNWLDENDDMPLIIDHLVDSVISRRSINSAEFMTLVQGVDGFWQRFREDAYRMTHNIPEKNNIGLNTILRELRNEFDEILRNSKNQTDDEAIKNTRDFYSHLLKKGKKQKVLEGQGLYEATCYLRNLLMCCVMKETGFSKDSIKKIMQQ